jgi:uncharacterized protein involved in exopolysaccharide biosynthesis
MAIDNTTSSGIVKNKELDLTILNNVIKKTWYFIPLIFIFFLSLTYLYLRYTKPVFESSTIIQIISEDQGADILNIKSINESSSLSREIELLRSQFLFEKAIKNMGFYISHFAEGDVLTQELYTQSNFQVIPYALHDSTLVNQRINIDLSDDKIILTYSNNGKTKYFELFPDQLLENEDFKIKILIKDWKSFIVDAEKNKLYFYFNDIESLSRRLHENLNVEALNPQARTIEISYQSNNPVLSRDMVQSVAQAFFDNDEKIKKESAQKVLNFIDKQLDASCCVLHSGKTGFAHHPL